MEKEQSEPPQSISIIPIPDDLKETQKAEFIAYQKSVIKLEEEWKELMEGRIIDQNCINTLDQIKAKRIKEANERLKIRVQLAEEQAIKERERIESEFEDAKRELHEKLVMAYSLSDQNIVNQLKELKGKDFQSYITENAIDFPSSTPDTQMRTRTQLPDEVKIGLSPQECEKDLRYIRSIVQTESYHDAKNNTFT
ncbi:hypothetical protein GPJ56_008033 [Histomonas meleagridis]|uniref:uncharacterized protein n=1 Tax=Histomonas meleagridis TaxID=135588 RepID=UPI0035594980|nr:hypothetical protein GPJ56_008033 [Histomonas meleagridis]KAH0804905.1 hypothetical protein GO595_002298 [Histomonas meleagridis]